MDELIKITNLNCIFGQNLVLKNINFSVKCGEFISILGCNGSGKTTLIKHINGLIRPQCGDVLINGISTKNQDNSLKKTVGMVFQNPDNQFVSTSIDEDIAFGLNNFDFPKESFAPLTAKALETVGLSGYENRSTFTLSGGQKQRAAIAGVLAVEPEIILFDEATSMLDTNGKDEVLSVIQRLHSNKKTIISVTHSIEEARLSERIILMSQGQIIADGATETILANSKLLQLAKLLPPNAVRFYEDLKANGITLKNVPLSAKTLADEIAEALCL